MPHIQQQRPVPSGQWSAGASVSRGCNLTIGQVARLTGISAKTIRYYETVGFLPPATRGVNRYRRYGRADINRLLLLRCVRMLGAPLAAARTLLLDTASARCAEVRDDLLALVDQRLHAIDQQIAELRSLRDEVDRYAHALADCQPAPSELFASCTDMRCIAELPAGGAEEQHHGELCRM
ncbi:MAG: MerR family transcriptional regulator [Ktedonobacterales bacterium]